MSGRCPSLPQRDEVYIKQLHALGCLTDSFEADIFGYKNIPDVMAKGMMSDVDFWFACRIEHRKKYEEKQN